MLNGFFGKLFSREALAKAVELVKEQPKAETAEQGKANHQRVVDGLYAFIEDADDRLKLIPYAGPIAASLADSPAVDALEREACEFVVEQAYRVLVLADKLSNK